MSALGKTIKAHFIHVKSGLFSQQCVEFAPSVGDELRFAGEKYFVVTKLVWIFDEPEAQYSRLNIGIDDAI